MPAKLTVIAGPSEGKVFTLSDDTKSIIGRGEAAQIVVLDPTVSRAHCLIEYFGARAVLKDNGSKTGTRVNGKAVTEHELRLDDVINVGTTKIRFQPLVQLRPAGQVDDEEEDEEHEELRALSGTKLAHFDIGTVVALGSSGVVFRARTSRRIGKSRSKYTCRSSPGSRRTCNGLFAP